MLAWVYLQLIWNCLGTDIKGSRFYGPIKWTFDAKLVQDQYYILSFSVSNPDRVRGFLTIPEFPEDPCICPVATIRDYLSKVGNVYLLHDENYLKALLLTETELLLNPSTCSYSSYSHRLPLSGKAAATCSCPWPPLTRLPAVRLSPAG